jgi:hypothetical protein
MRNDTIQILRDEISNYIQILYECYPHSMKHQTHPYRERLAYGLGMCRILGVIEGLQPAGGETSIDMAIELMRAARTPITYVEGLTEGRSGRKNRKSPNRRAGDKVTRWR